LEPAVVVRIHPGQSSLRVMQVLMDRRASGRASLALSALLGMVLAGPLGGQVLRRPPAPSEEPVDSSDLRNAAKRAQAAFERRRVRLLPPTGFGVGYGGECTEIVGRFCVTSEDGYWSPPPEPEQLTQAREKLLVELDSLQRLVSGDGWLLGQRVWYRGEAGRWEDALTAARSCGDAEPWWCAALEGLAYHGLGRYVEAEEAFGRALSLMDPRRARQWQEPRRALDRDAWKVLDRAEGQEREATLDRLWMLADPLYLVSGNDRLTGHFARWTVATLREGARNAHGIRWGRDLEELMVRHGWAVGWERVRSRSLTQQPDAVVAHDHPEGRSFLPVGSGLEDPAHAGSEDFLAERDRVRSLYAPAYAPVFLPMDGQVAVFPRTDSIVVVATHFLPADTTERRGGSDSRPWLEAGDQAGRPDRAGLFLVPVGGGAPLSRVEWAADGVSVLPAPAGAYVVSVEAWSPPARRAGRLRMGLARDSTPPDVPTLSDLLLVRGGGPEPVTLRAAAQGALLRPQVLPGDEVALVWEMGGLGWRPETVTYALVVERRDRGILRRLGQRLGLVDAQRPLSLSWSEPGPERPRILLRRVALAFAELNSGTYRVRLEAQIPGRATLRSERVFVVPDPTR